MKKHITLTLSFLLLISVLTVSLTVPSSEAVDTTETSSYIAYPLSSKSYSTTDIVRSMETHSHFFKAKYTGKYIIRGCYLDLQFIVTENIIGETDTEEIMVELTYATYDYLNYPLDGVKISDSCIKADWHTFEAGKEYFIFTELSRMAYNPYDIYKLVLTFYGPADDIGTFKHSIYCCVDDKNVLSDMFFDPLTGLELEPSEVHSRFISYIKEQAKEHPLNGGLHTNAVCIKENDVNRIIKESPRILKVKVLKRDFYPGVGDYYNQEHYYCEFIYVLKGENVITASSISFFPDTVKPGEEYIVCLSTADDWEYHLSSKYGVFPASEENRIKQIIAKFEN